MTEADVPSARLLSCAGDWGRAPSAHNTQPWRVAAEGPDRVVLGWHGPRALPVGDPTGRDLMLSLGCAAEAMALTASGLGLRARVTWAVDRAAHRAGRLDLVATAPGGEGDFSVQDLHGRRTARSGYLEPGPGEAEVADLVAAAGGVGGLRVVVLPAEEVRTALRVADRWTFESGATAELRGWLRLDPADPRYRLDGLTDAALGLTRWERRGLALALTRPGLAVLRRSGLTRVLAHTATARPLGTVVALVGPAHPCDEALADAGRHLLRVWLATSRRGLSSHPLSQLLDCPRSAAQLRTALGPDQPYAVWRVGRPMRPPVRSGRLSDPDRDRPGHRD